MVIWEVFISKVKAVKVTKIQLNVENECLLSHLPKLSSWTSLQGRFWVLVFDTPDLDLPAVCVCVCLRGGKSPNGTCSQLEAMCDVCFLSVCARVDVGSDMCACICAVQAGQSLHKSRDPCPPGPSNPRGSIS